MSENNFLVFNEEQDEEMTMSDTDYLASDYRVGGVVRGIADPAIHNKMYLQWSTMSKAVADMISSKGYDATDESAADLKNSLISAISDIAEEAGGGGGASDSKERKASTAYALEDIATVSTFKSYKYLECVVAGTSGSGNIINEYNVGQLIFDGTVTWLVCDMRDASPVGSIKYDYLVRPGWIKCNGARIFGNYYPRLFNYLNNNNLATTIHASSLSSAEETVATYHANNPGKFYLAHGTTNDEYKIQLPDLTGRFIEGADSAGTAVDAGLPNITGRIEANMFGISHGGVFVSSTGAFFSDTYETTTNITGGSNTTSRYRAVNLSASDSNSIYGNSTTVQPPAVQMIPLIKY